MTPYVPSSNRYDSMHYRRCGRSGLLLPELSLGLWQNFGDDHLRDVQRVILRRAFDLGVTHFDLANNYGPPYGSAETNFGAILRTDFKSLRDDLIISTKAGWDMWPGPYGDHGSRKYLLASLDQSLGRLGIDYVDIFYHHRFDPDTPLEETLGALDAAVRQGKALYVGVSSYSDRRTSEAVTILRGALNAAPYQSSFVFDAQSLDRGTPARCTRARGRWMHRVFATRGGPSDRPLPRRHPGGFSCGFAGRHVVEGNAEQREP